MSRPDRARVLMDTAFLWADRSTCSRLHVGCVISREGRILVQGYNGAPAGLAHCNHECNCNTSGYPYSKGGDEVHISRCRAPLPCLRAVHAEQNAVSFAARYGVGLEGAEASVTNQPCMSCAMSLINAGISSVTYSLPYRLTDGLELLLEAGIKVLTLDPPRDRIHA